MKEIKVVYNGCHGGFGLSTAAQDLYIKKTGRPFDRAYSRHDPALVEVVEELGDGANGKYAKLRIATVAGKYRIDEYDGSESVETPDSYEWIEP